VNNAIDIVLLGQSFTVNCPVGEEKILRSIAANLDQTMQTVQKRTKIQHREQVTVMAALQVGYELYQERLNTEHHEKILDDRVYKLQIMLEDALTQQTK
jgi:cell division protein ZapA